MNSSHSDSRLAALFSTDDTLDGFWSAEDLKAIWKHHLHAPLAVDLLDAIPAAEKTLQSLNMPASRFIDLFTTPVPIELLVLLKDFAKQLRQEKSVASEIATGIYFLIIAMALQQHDRRITDLDNAKLVSGFTWLIDQPWLDQQSREMASAARRKLGS